MPVLPAAAAQQPPFFSFFDAAFSVDVVAFLSSFFAGADAADAAGAAADWA